jgi:8-oxo-dGTP pyrophosphatase MutT (NUDIX family)
VIFRSAVESLRTALAGALPGEVAQDLMAPRPRREWPADFKPEDVRHAAGLLLLFPIEERAHVILTVRGDALARHRGQVSMPGGVMEPGETVERAALREAHEEIGLDPAVVEPIGALTPVDIPVSGFRLHPVVGAMNRRPELAPADGEVARILEVPLETLIDPGTVQGRPLTRDGRVMEVPTFVTAGVEIWGATAMALAELLTLIGWHGPEHQRSR